VKIAELKQRRFPTAVSDLEIALPCLGSARASRVGDGALAIANLLVCHQFLISGQPIPK
jgi:hypothetical protein